MFRKEKLQDEVAVMEYIRLYTSIPVPQVFGKGDSVVGPYMILVFVEGMPLSDHLRASQDPQKPSTLKLDIKTDTLRRAYRSMADILLELYRCRFPAIGGLVQDETGRFSVKKRAVAFNMNEIVGLSKFPPERLSQDCFSNAISYFESLADDHFHHLEMQRNDAVTDEADCRKKYVVRRLFLKIARDFSKNHDYGPFPLLCDDLRPSNVIVDADMNVQSVIDWEFCYAGPLEFSHCSPWWLLLARPQTWEPDIDDFLVHYTSRQKLFLEILRDRESELARECIQLGSPLLSDQMARSLEDGTFWFHIAATYSFSFDDIYRRFIHPRYYGRSDSVEDLRKLLSEEEEKDMEPFIRKILDQAKEGGLDTYRTLEEMMQS
ncbi:phosphotransferase family protein [Aspergillus lucknowensis]|uniref:Aminoglycoside phosphotransferase domain-containing protein n=1 Tax=Aspergillus lucknowensis TaxID=176173 RepID=A0ABR4M680_9EURO